MRKVLLAVVLALAACGGPEAPSLRTNIVAPGQGGSLLALASSALSCAPTAISWSITEPDGGTITADGVYKAPPCGSSVIGGTVHIVASGCAKSVTIGISVQEAVQSVTIPYAVEHLADGSTCLSDPALAFAPPGGTIDFYAAVAMSCRTVYDPPLPATWPPPPCP